MFYYGLMKRLDWCKVRSLIREVEVNKMWNIVILFDGKPIVFYINCYTLMIWLGEIAENKILSRKS